MQVKFSRIILDGDIWLHRAVVHATTRVQFDEVEHWEVDLRSAGGWLRQQFAQLKARLGASHMIIALGDRHQNFRKELCPTYKANRTAFPKPPGFLALEAKLQVHAKTVSAPRLEGDDVLGILATQPRDGVPVIVSVDKDLLQIPGWNYNPDTDTLTETRPDEGRYRHLFQTLTGDRVDGYPGLPGCGPVKAAKILAAFEEPEEVWPGIVAAYEKAGQTEEQALLQARLAWVLRHEDYDKKTREIRLWTPE